MEESQDFNGHHHPEVEEASKQGLPLLLESFLAVNLFFRIKSLVTLVSSLV